MKIFRARRSVVASALFCLCIGAQAQDRFALENPVANSFVSGVGLISGWACNAATAASLAVLIDGTTTIPVARGTTRTDTAAICARTDTGFGLLVNWNTLGAGPHTAQLLVGGAPTGSTRGFTVVVHSGEFSRGLSTRDFELTDFPVAGRKTVIFWSDSNQNFQIRSVTSSATAGPSGTVAGTYRCQAVGSGSADGSVTIAADGNMSLQFIDSSGVAFRGSGIVSNGTINSSSTGTLNSSNTGVSARYVGTFTLPAGASRATGSGTWSSSEGTSGTWTCV